MSILAMPGQAQAATGPCVSHDVTDLADHVYDHMAAIARDDATSGFIVHRHATDGSAAITFRAGVVDAYTAVLRWTLTGWAERLREHGFTVHVETRDDRGEKDVPQWLRVTGWSAGAVTTRAAGPGVGEMLGDILAASDARSAETDADERLTCDCDACGRWREANVAPTRPHRTSGDGTKHDERN